MRRRQEGDSRDPIPNTVHETEEVEPPLMTKGKDIEFHVDCILRTSAQDSSRQKHG